MLDYSIPSDGAPEEEILFDADRDNEGEGVSPDQMIVILKNMQKGE